MTRWQRGALIAGCAVLIAYPACWIGVQHTDAYRVAASFVQNDAGIAAAIGPVRQVTLPLLASYSIEVSGGTGSAVFEMAIEAERSQAKAFVGLRKRGVWEISEARLVTASGATTPLAVPR
jgi:hypothetical protein